MDGQNPAILPAFANWQLLTLGVILITLEVTLLNFFILLWFGIAAILVGIWGFFIPFEHGEYQLLATAVMGTGLLLLFRNRFLAINQKAPEMPLETFKAGETGKLMQQNDTWMIEYQGSCWQVANPTDYLKEGETVQVTKVENNRVWIQPPEAS